MQKSVTVAVDAMGGDFAPHAVLEGIKLALEEDPHLKIQVVGPDEVVTQFANKHDRVNAVITTQVIEMCETPASAVRAKKDSSIVVGARLVKDGEAGGFFTAGSTGAGMAAATLVIGRIKGINRPALATVLPAIKKPTILLDIGANAEVKTENLLQNAIMGEAYARSVFNINKPEVALLNIGEEESKGNQQAIEAYALLKEKLPFFVGNIEGGDVLSGNVDVIVTDGFTGNVTLKLLEGTSKTILGLVKTALTDKMWKKLLVAPLAGAMRGLKVRMDPDQYGGAPLLGIKGVACIGHGSSNPTAIKNGILFTARTVRGDVVQKIESTLAEVSAEG